MKRSAEHKKKYRTGMLNESGQQICGAMTKSKDRHPCRLVKISDRNGRCKFHGGKTPSGVASPHYVDGRASKYIVKGRHADAFARLKASDKLMDQMDEIAALTTLNQELFDEISNADGLPNFPALKTAYVETRKALREKDTQGLVEGLDNLGGLIMGGAYYLDANRRFQAGLLAQSKVIESQMKKIAQDEAVISVTESYNTLSLFLQGIATAVLAHVKDRDVQQLILAQTQDAYDVAISANAPAIIDG